MENPNPLVRGVRMPEIWHQIAFASLRDEEADFNLEKSMPFRLLAAFSEREARFNSFIAYMID